MTSIAVIDLPNHLDYVAGSFPNGVSLTADCLLDQHTLLPFFSAFLPPDRVEKLREDMKGSSGPAAYLRSGIMACRIPLPKCLRFCPLCKKKDEYQFGEAYWHRLHQLPGVLVCPIHHLYLADSDASRSFARKHLQFIPIEGAISNVQVRHLDLANPDHQFLLKIARDTLWLMEHPNPGSDLSALHNRYLRLLINHGLATYTGSIHAGKFLSEFKNHYSPTLLKLLSCEFSGRDQVKTNWLLRLVRNPKHAQHPLYHLLLMQFLGCTAEEFFQLPEELNFFGEGPWPCLNTVADHYKQEVIGECQHGKRLRNNNPVGIFSCECGFSYARTGPDTLPSDRFRIGKMISFGPIWEEKLKELWKDSTLSMSEIGRQLGVDPLTVRKHAVRLKIPFSRSGRKTKPLRRSIRLKGNSTLAAWKKKRRTCRSKWLSAMKQNRKITMKALRRIFPREYAWLLQNDSRWLNQHKPLSKKPIKSTSSVDWKRRDAEYAVAVKDAVSRIKDAPGRPVQVTKTAIGRAIGAVTLLQQKIYKMPLTALELATVIETREEYAVRRVWWAANLYSQETQIPRKWELVLRANVYTLMDAPKVAHVLDTAINMIKSSVRAMSVLRVAS